MAKYIKIILYRITILLFISFFSLSILKVSTNAKEKEIKKDYLGIISIDKINLKETFYDINNPNNTIEKHVSILKESIFPELLILAAHSGTANIAYFNDLDKLEIKDTIKIEYQEKTYFYEVKDIWEEKKTGYIHINKEKDNQLILTACSPKRNGYQLIINSIKKES